MSSGEGKFVSALIAGTVVGVWFFFDGFRTLRHKRQIENTPTSKVRSVAIGLTEVYGKAVPLSKEHVKKSPLLGKECVYYHLLIEEYKKQGKNSTWVPIKSDEYKEPFYIQDDTGTILIDAKTAQIDLPKDFYEESKFGKDPSPKVMKYLNAHKIEFESGWFKANKTMRYTEKFIAVGDSVYVMGDAMPTEFKSLRGAEHIHISRRDKKSFFYISDRPEKDILKEFGKFIFLKIFGGAVLCVICLGILFAYFNIW